MTRLLMGLVVTLAYAGAAAAQPVADHLKCFKVKDSQPKTLYKADLSGHVAESGCTIKFPAAMACVPATKANVQPTPAGGGGTGTPNAFGCYKIKCPKGTPPPLQLEDQFGIRSVEVIKSKLLCAPLSPTCFEPFEEVLAPFLNAFLLPIGADGNFEVPPSCGGSIETCCSGGTPSSPCGPLHVDVSGGSVVEVVGGDRFDVRLTMRAATVADIPIRGFGADCFLRIDTAPGSSRTIEIVMPLSMSADHRRIESVGDVTINGFTDDDFEIVGGFFCQSIDFGSDFIIDTLKDSLADDFRGFAGLCRVCDSDSVAPCDP